MIVINTSNIHKQQEFKRFFRNCTFTNIDVDEPLTKDPNIIVAYKATKIGAGILIDDTTINVEGFDFTTDIKYKLNQLVEYAQSLTSPVSANIQCRLAILRNNIVNIYLGQVDGLVVPPYQQDAKVIRTVFKPTHGQFNHRQLACQNFLNHIVYMQMSPIHNWSGQYQE